LYRDPYAAAAAVAAALDLLLPVVAFGSQN